MNFRNIVALSLLVALVVSSCSLVDQQPVTVGSAAASLEEGPIGSCNKTRDNGVASAALFLNSSHWQMLAWEDIEFSEERGDDLVKTGLGSNTFSILRDDALLLQNLRLDGDQSILVIANLEQALAGTFVVVDDSDFYFVDPCDDHALGDSVRSFAEAKGLEASTVLLDLTLHGETELWREYFGAETENLTPEDEWYELRPEDRTLNPADAPLEVVDSLHAIDAEINIRRGRTESGSMVCFLTDLGWTAECLALDVLVNGKAGSTTYDVVVDVPASGQVRVFVGSTDASLDELVDSGLSVEAASLIDGKARGTGKFRVDLRERNGRLDVEKALIADD